MNPDSFVEVSVLAQKILRMRQKRVTKEKMEGTGSQF